MAARPPKPPGNPTIPTETEDVQHQFECFETKTQSNCSCTNISIMQLFHEMKQKYPTVPDHVVNQCVIDNCHDRANCIKSLENELVLHPNTAQAYPSHALRNNLIAGVKQLQPTRPAPQAPSAKTCNTNYCDPVLKNHLNNNTTTILNVQNFSDMSDNGKIVNLNNCVNQVPPQRPTTLKFHETSVQQQQRLERQQQQHTSRPVRRAPLPPPATIVVPSHPDQSFSSSSTSIQQQSPINYSDSGESEISFNISLSPSSERSRSAPQLLPASAPATPQRHIAKLSVQPELPYASLTSPAANQKSFTSLNLTLRKPSSTPQSPIDITAGPGLTYSSSSYDPRRGYQKNFHITVNDQGGVFSASRVRPRSAYNPSFQYAEEEFSNLGKSNALRPATSEQNILLHGGDSSGGVYAGQYHQQNAIHAQVIHRQRSRKSQLTKALDKNKRRLDQVQQEIEVLHLPVTPGESERLDREIENLRCDCADILNKIEIASQSGLIVNNNEVPYSNNNINNDRQEPFPRQRRPPRPPPPLQSPHHQQQHSPIVNQQQQQPLPISPASQPQQHHLSISTSSSTDDDPSSDASSAEYGPQWTCSMCTFQNHPLLNKCEYCENVRIIPGTIRIVPSSTMQNNRNVPPESLSSPSTVMTVPSASVTASLSSSGSDVLLSHLPNNNSNPPTESDNLTTPFALHT